MLHLIGLFREPKLIIDTDCFSRTMAARFEGVLHGIYQCHTRQMVVKKPLNINDEDIVDGINCTGKPSDQPTSMSYSLQRIRLSEISRSMVDRTPLIMAQDSGPNHDIIMDIDTELQLLINDTPPFFSMSIANVTKTYQLDPSRAANIVHQGYMFHSLFYGLRCKLHFPYFSRGYADPAYASSREICLQSASLIVQTETRLEFSGSCMATRYRFIGLLVGVFMASIVLLIDLCHNNLSPQQEKQRGEIADAFRILEDARHESRTAAKFLESLMHVLRKHKVSPPKSAGQQLLQPKIDCEQLPTASSEAAIYNAVAPQPYGELAGMSTSMTPPCVSETNEVRSINMNGHKNTDGDNWSLYFNELDRSFGGIDVDSFDWDNIISGLDSSVIYGNPD